MFFTHYVDPLRLTRSIKFQLPKILITCSCYHNLKCLKNNFIQCNDPFKNRYILTLISFVKSDIDKDNNCKSVGADIAIITRSRLGTCE